MKLREVAEVIKGVHVVEGQKREKTKLYKEITMVSLEPISFIDERKLIEINANTKVVLKHLTQAGDIVVSLYHPMIACYVEKGQEGYVVPHFMAIVRMKPFSQLDSRFIAQFINSARGRRVLLKTSKAFNRSRPTSLPLITLNEVELLDKVNSIVERL